MPRHGRGMTVENWMDDGMEAVAIGHRLGKKVILVGMSTGAITWRSGWRPRAVAPLISRLVLLSPNYCPKNPLAVGRHVLAAVISAQSGAVLRKQGGVSALPTPGMPAIGP